VVAFRLLPLAYSLVLSFFDASAFLSNPAFAGFDNYAGLLRDQRFWRSVGTTAVYMAGSLALLIPASLLVAAGLRRSSPWTRALRVVFLLPAVLPGTVTAVVWSWLYEPYFGPVNQLLRIAGIDGPAWLKDPEWALPALMVMGAWRELGLAMLIYLAALGGIHPEIEQAAAVDGAGAWERWRWIVLPLLRPATLVVALTSGLRLFDMFTPVFVMTGGGPAGATTTWTYYLYITAFERYRTGYGSAMAILVSAVVALLLWLAHRYGQRGRVVPSA